MNFVFIYLGEECLVIIYSVSELAMGKLPVCLQPGWDHFLKIIAFSYLDSEYTICIKDFEMKLEHYHTRKEKCSTSQHVVLK